MQQIKRGIGFSCSAFLNKATQKLNICNIIANI